jgi:hypothetical protein
VSGETGKSESGLTVDTLKLLLDERDRRYEQRFESQKEAVSKATAALERRLEGMNEIRAAMSEQAATFLPRGEYDSAHDSLVARVNDLNDRINRTEGKSSGVTSSLGALLAIAGVVIALVTVAVTIIIATR